MKHKGFAVLFITLAYLSMIAPHGMANNEIRAMIDKVLKYQPIQNKDRLEEGYLQQARKEGHSYYFSIIMKIKGEGTRRTFGSKKKTEYNYQTSLYWTDEILSNKLGKLTLDRSIQTAETIMISGDYKQSHENAVSTFLQKTMKYYIGKKIEAEKEGKGVPIKGFVPPGVYIETGIPEYSALATSLLQGAREILIDASERVVNAAKATEALDDTPIGQIATEAQKTMDTLSGKRVRITFEEGEGIVAIENIDNIEDKDFKRLCNLYTRFAFFQQRSLAAPKDDQTNWRIPAAVCGNILSLDEVGRSYGQIFARKIDRKLAEKHPLYQGIKLHIPKSNDNKLEFCALDVAKKSQVQFQNPSGTGWSTTSSFTPTQMLFCHYPDRNMLCVMAIQGSGYFTASEKRRVLPDIETTSKPTVSFIFAEYSTENM